MAKRIISDYQIPQRTTILTSTERKRRGQPEASYRWVYIGIAVAVIAAICIHHSDELKQISSELDKIGMR